MKSYVGIICFSPDLARMVVLNKAAGPAELVGKLNFPGGKVEETETLPEAASREFLEETGLAIPVARMGMLSSVGIPGEYQLTVFYTISADIDHVRTLTDEEVSVVSITDLLSAANSTPETLAPDLPAWIYFALDKATKLNNCR